MRKLNFFHLAMLLMGVLILAACKEDEAVGKLEITEETKKEIVQTFLMYSETSETEDQGSVGDLYVKTLSSDREKIASNVINEQYKYIQSNDTVLFLTSDNNLYEYKKGSDKEKIASNVVSFDGGYANNLTFYQNDESDLYIFNEARESEKIASSVDQIDMIGSDLYYLDSDGNLNVYNIESHQEIALGSDIYNFMLLNADGDFVYTNDDYMLFYKQKDKDPVKISGKEVSPYFIEQVDQGFVYIATEDEEQVLYLTSLDGSETIKIAMDVDMYELKGDNIVYSTYDQNLFMKKAGDEAALKLASDVSYFSVADDVVFYVDVENTVYSVTNAGKKTKKATNAESIRITAANELIYENSDAELFLNDTKLATDIDDYALFSNNLAYGTNDDKLYFMADLGEAVVVEEDLTKYSVVTYQNKKIFSNYLTFADLSGDWKITMEGETGFAHISADGSISNKLNNTTTVFEVVYAGYNYIEVKYDGNEDSARFEYDGGSLTLTDGYNSLFFEKTTKKEAAAASESVIEKVEEKSNSQELGEQRQLDEDETSYILPNSSFEYLTNQDIAHFTIDQLRLVRNEIFARNGYIFNSEDLNAYFAQKTWYVPNSSFSDAQLSETEKANINFIKSVEKSK